MQTVLKLM